MPTPVDEISLNFSPESLLAMKFTLMLIMFGVSLDLSLEDFKRVFKHPRSPLIGLFSQFLVLPALTFVFVSLIKPLDSFALGMFLVAACPGGNISNFISSLAKANVALSVSITALATAASIFMTPLNFAFWSNLYFQEASIDQIHVGFWDMFFDILLILTLPLLAGMLVAKKFPSLTGMIRKPMKIISILIFAAYVVIALYNNFDFFMAYIHIIFAIVVIHNAIALLGGYTVGKLSRLPFKEVKSITIETGIQNSGLALVLIFDPRYFEGLGGMSLIAAFWGIWHIVAGMMIATFWAGRKT